jgi:hypothetical protein
MEVIKYQKDKHFSQLAQWCKQWDLPLQWLDVLPTTGLIVENTAAIFAYKTDSKVCFIDQLICNKDTKREDRDAALDKLVDILLHTMKEKGFSYIASNSSNPKVLELALRHGFTVDSKPVTFFMRQI